MQRALVAVLFLPSAAAGDVLEVPGQFQTIQQAVDAATAGDEIVVAPGSYAGFESSVDVIVRGDGSSPDDTTIAGLIEVFDRFSIENLEVAGGLYSPGFDQISIENCAVIGQGIVIHNTNLIVTDTRFEGCEDGAVVISDSNTSFTDCDFVGNSTSQGGGAISCSDSVLIIDNCRFIENLATQNGGAIEANTFASELVITDSAFLGNTAHNGGAIFNDVQFGECEIERCVFRENSSMSGAGALWMQGNGNAHPPGSIRDSEFEYNITTDLSGAAAVLVVGAIQPLPEMGGTRFCESQPTNVLGQFFDEGDNLFDAGCGCRADINGDGSLTPSDFSAWVSAYNSMSADCDQNSDGACDPADFSSWVTNYNAGCP